MFKKLKRKAINKLRDWLHIEQDRAALRIEINRLENTLQMIKDQILIGVDHHVYKDGNESWAVVCIRNKPEFVNFYRLREDESKNILQFLKGFDRKNVTMDTPVQFLKDWRF